MSWIFGGGKSSKVQAEDVEPELKVDGGADLPPEDVEVRVVPVREDHVAPVPEFQEEKKEVSRLQYLKIDEGVGVVQCSCGAFADGLAGVEPRFWVIEHMVTGCDKPKNSLADEFDAALKG